MFRMQDQVLQRLGGAGPGGHRAAGPDTPADARLAEHATFFDFVCGELPEILKCWDAYRAGPG